MTYTTTTLGLKLPVAGTLEPWDTSTYGQNLQTLETALLNSRGVQVGTPSAPYAGELARDDATGDVSVYIASSGVWEVLASGNPREVMTASQNQADVSNNGQVQAASSPASFTVGRAQNALVLFSAEASTTGSNAAGNLYLQHNGVNLLPTKRIQALSSTTGRRDITLVGRVRLVAGVNAVAFLASSDQGGTQISYTDISFKVVTV